MADKALAELDALPASAYRDSMAQLARLAVDRQA
jgi:octaprenyl-diphosphate synthase